MAKSHPAGYPGELAPTRLTLIERLRNLDDHGSWQEFFDIYWRLIYLAAVKGGLPESDAEDVVQETIIGIAKNMENFRYQPEVCSFKGWLMHVTRCRIIDHLRKMPERKRTYIPLPTDTQIGEYGGQYVGLGSPMEKTFETLWDEEWEKNLVDAAMERVKRKVAPEHYQIFYLQTVKGMSARDVGELCGVSLAKVYVVRHRIGRLVRSEFRSLEKKGLPR